MELIKPSSILRNYNKVIDEIEEGKPVILTKNGVGKAVLVNINEWNRQQAEIWLMNELDQADKEFDDFGGKNLEEFAKKYKLGEFGD
jgi:prevent-host-death family protein